MHRLFVAVDLPEEVRASLIVLQPRSLRGARLVGRREMHLTLHFLGATEDASLPAIRAALAAVKASPFAIDLEGVGCFPEAGEPRVLWAGVRGGASLTALHRTMARALAEAVGFVPEDRPYRPHVTLAHLDTATPRKAVENYLVEQASFRMGDVPITCFALYSSSRTRQGPRYEVEASFGLS